MDEPVTDAVAEQSKKKQQKPRLPLTQEQRTANRRARYDARATGKEPWNWKGKAARPRVTDQPCVIVQCPFSHKARFMQWMIENYSCEVVGHDERLIFFALKDKSVPIAEAAIQLTKAIGLDPVVNLVKQAMGVFPVTDSIKGDIDAMQGLKCGGHKVRVQAFPRKVTEEVAACLTDVVCTPRYEECTHVLSAIPYRKFRTYYSLLPKEHFEALIESKAALGDVQAQRRLEDAAPDANNASRAYYKVHEAFLREKLSFTRHHVALDVGAAPGGWAFYLSKMVGRVAACDPGALTIPCIPFACDAGSGAPEHDPGAVFHIKKPIEESTNEMSALGPFDVVTSDVNQPIGESLLLISSVVPYMTPGALLILTVKHWRPPTRREVGMPTIEEVIRIAFTNVRSQQLFSNKKLEVTVICNLREDMDPAEMGQKLHDAASKTLVVPRKKRKVKEDSPEGSAQ